MFKDLGGEIGTVLATMSLVVFFATFVSVALFLLTDRRRGHIRRMAAMPLDDRSAHDDGAAHPGPRN